jgi:hypothetical protein
MGVDYESWEQRNDQQTTKLNFIEFEEFHVNRSEPKEKFSGEE